MTETAPLAEQTPVEIDTALYALYNEDFEIRLTLTQYTQAAHQQAGDKYDYYRKAWGLSNGEAWDRVEVTARDDQTYVGQNAQRLLDNREAKRREQTANQDAQAPLHAEYRRRPWTRAFLVTDGHVHSSMECSTCFPTTRFTWLVDLSGKSEAEIVDLAGERACTVCYPSAPTLRSFEKASPLFTEEEAERAAQREQRAAEKAARDAKKIEKALTADGSEFVVEYPGYKEGSTSRERFKTERAAVIWATDRLAAWNPERYVAAVRVVAEAVASKHGRTVEDVLAEFEKKAAKKRY